MNLIASIIVVTNIGFTAAFDTSTRCPSWVAYDLEPSEVVQAKRLPISFAADPRIAETDLAKDYRASGYDRGHMAPAADFNWSTNALRETYYFSNIAPQVPSVNRGTWSSVESEVRALAASGTVHVVTFPYGFCRDRAVGRISVPKSFVKIAYGYFGVRYWKIENKETVK